MKYYLSGQSAAAAEWFRKATKQGDREALTRLGYMEWKGKGVSQDMTSAVRHTKQAAQMGSKRLLLAQSDWSGFRIRTIAGTVIPFVLVRTEEPDQMLKVFRIEAGLRVIGPASSVSGAVP